MIKHSPLTTHDKNDDDDTSGEYNDDEIWCLLVPAFHSGDKANVPTYLPRHCFPGSNTVEHFLNISYFYILNYKQFKFMCILKNVPTALPAQIVLNIF